MNIEQLMGALGAPPDPAMPVLTMPAALAERIAEKLAGIDLHGSELSELRALLAMPAPQLWAIHSPGPGETYPCLDREDAEKQAAKITDYVEQSVGERPTVNVIPSPWEPAEHFEIMAGEWMEDAETTRETAISLHAKVAELEALIGKQVTSAPEQAEQPASTTSDQYRAELYDEVWQKARDMGYGNVTEALVALERVNEQAEQQSAWVEQVMEQAQVFASAWALVGGPFDTGDGLKQAKEEKELLRKLLEASR